MSKKTPNNLLAHQQHPNEVSQSLPSCYKIKTSKEFSRHQQKSYKFNIDPLLFSYRHNGLRHARLGLVLTRKNGSAVERNLCKRRLRELFRKSVLRELSFDIVVRVRGELSKVTWEVLKNAWDILEAKIK